MSSTKSPSTNRVLVIGIGNEYAQDDAAGLLVARNLKEAVREGIETIESAGDAAALIESWKGISSVIVIDAVCSGAEPGKTFRFEAYNNPLPAQPFRASSTHAFGLHAAVELARSLQQLPQNFIVYGIEGRNFTAGTDVSSAVMQAVSAVTQSVLEELKALRRLSA